MITMSRVNNVRTGCEILRIADGLEELIRHSRLGNVKQNGISGLRVIEHIIGRRFRSVSNQVEIVAVIRKCSLQRKQCNSRNNGDDEPGPGEPHNAGSRQNDERRQAENEIAAKEKWPGQREQQYEQDWKEKPQKQKTKPPALESQYRR